MEELKEKLIQRAKKRHQQEILPCKGKTFDECFVVEERTLHFFYNTEDDTTHLLTEAIA
jgi:hypothetical protein